MPSLACRLVCGYLRMSRASWMYSSFGRASRHLQRSSVRPRRHRPPRGLRGDVTTVVEERLGWPVYTLTSAHGQSRGSVVYLYGGGWVDPIVRQHWHLACQTAAEAGTRVVVPIYPLVPFGTAENVVSVVASLVHSLTGTGSTRLAGDPQEARSPCPLLWCCVTASRMAAANGADCAHPGPGAQQSRDRQCRANRPVAAPRGAACIRRVLAGKPGCHRPPSQPSSPPT